MGASAAWLLTYHATFVSLVTESLFCRQSDAVHARVAAAAGRHRQLHARAVP
jgi:hypothetical protein